MTHATDGACIPVHPRYLAASDGCADPVFAPLIGPRWHKRTDEWGNYHAFGDQGRLHIGLIPEYCELVEPVGLWHIEARPHRDAPALWRASMSDCTPPEIIAALTTALAADVETGGDRPPYLRHSGPPDTVWSALTEAGWQHSISEFDARALAPDLLAEVTHTPPRPGPAFDQAREEAWQVEVRISDEGEALWWAEFHSDTPAHLLTAFAAALASPQPLWRTEHTLPPQVRRLINGA
ncbi:MULTISPECIES: DUF317 domain-containing protein [Streptomyces]|uniref:DUF317 domain-containing protein n=1 Tax=Streptomyces lonegramiae TaxID=3075524 RepID=A0ABU2XP61_9ACTN|nr:DUF317 domain-containing protein [Streptomyces sp. DSM 41529]MDT0547718.1 DUF317 domain-containing protein [Streptomyces sp. DSM 41529]